LVFLFDDLALCNNKYSRMKFGKTIKIFLIDGDPNGRMSCELSNWTGKAFKIPRIKIKDCVDRPEIKNPGIYFLFGKNEIGKDIIYIGEAETVYSRLLQHLNQKDFWNEAIIFISKDENLNKAHIKYLENKLYEIAKQVNRYHIDNTTVPTLSSISESDRAEMEEFLENVKLLVSTLGHKAFDTKRETSSIKPKDVFYLKGPRGADAHGLPTSDGFLVLKGSKAAESTTPSIASNLVKLRSKIIDQGAIILKKGYFEFPDDFIFSSASAAASIVLGRNANGLSEWKFQSGKTLKDFETNDAINEV